MGVGTQKVSSFRFSLSQASFSVLLIFRSHTDFVSFAYRLSGLATSSRISILKNTLIGASAKQIS